jgi:hypothetical protein
LSPAVVSRVVAIGTDAYDRHQPGSCLYDQELQLCLNGLDLSSQLLDGALISEIRSIIVSKMNNKPARDRSV